MTYPTLEYRYPLPFWDEDLVDGEYSCVWEIELLIDFCGLVYSVVFKIFMLTMTIQGEFQNWETSFKIYISMWKDILYQQI